MVEIQHHLLQLALAHLAVGDGDAGLRHQFCQIVGHPPDALDLVVQEVHLAAALEFALAGLAQQGLVPLPGEGLDRQPPGRRGDDDRQVAQPGQPHVEGARDRCGGQGEDVDLGA